MVTDFDSQAPDEILGAGDPIAVLEQQTLTERDRAKRDKGEITIFYELTETQRSDA